MLRKAEKTILKIYETLKGSSLDTRSKPSPAKPFLSSVQCKKVSWENTKPLQFRIKPNGLVLGFIRNQYF